ncbi:cell wall-associated NlpC family hydrolase [Streptomyces sp. SAI-135]|uniref:NlpC/P60 family protein n=1 Tax=unclassified Streptomyces TaxID=2593676 RepID=UPI00247379ED|nr:MULTISPECIES: NlpC/P60 family protein [unclassified Streptomyces]MDH6521495.1 cell wall-associated NlpC family hydrolase [Streptomyces sp. SAI-090]MDH6614407.1 cell wall-associated NlpC family hydrolase [Streptomyces sp. SAI-135]
MSHTTRRRLLAALAGSAAAPLTGLTAVPARAAALADVPAFPGPGGLSSARSWVSMAPLGAAHFTPVGLATPLTATVLPGTPARTEVTSGGKRVAVLTHGARTVVLPGPHRTFAENKRPFVDDFQRTLPDLALDEGDRAYWGASPGGGTWVTSETFRTDFSVVPGTGIVDLTTAGYSRHASLRDDEITDVDVRCTAAFDKVPTGQACSFALTFGYGSTQNHYRARLSFLTSGAVEMRLEKEVTNTASSLATAITLATGVPAGTEWTIRVRREGARIQAKAWRSASAEPASWAFDISDSTPTLVKGRVGVRALANEGCTNLPVRLSVSRLEVDAANWAVLPTVSHGDWVRVLPEPFDGTWTAQVEQTIRAWAGSTAPDVLAYAAMFLGGAAAVTAGAGPAQGKQVLGESGYGYLDTHGYRLEGADFHEYMKVGWTFPDGTYKGPSGKQVGNLDCSGYTRMVYGYHLGVPLAADEDTSGTRIPRKSRHMADYAPGVVVDRATGTTPPAATLLQPGDLVLFNADSSDDGVSQTIDHVGIYLGLDDDGRRRFLSSRKTVNGPTMSDLGGASLLDGSGTYARTLHTVRRV